MPEFRIGKLLAATAQPQGGLVTGGQALQAGISREELALLVAEGLWARLYGDVYLVGGVQSTWRTRLLAAVLAAGEHAAASHLSAAAVWELDGFTAARPNHLTVPYGRNPALPGLRDVRIHRCSHIGDLGIRKVGAIPVVSPAQAVLGVCATSPNPQIHRRALDDVRRRKLATWDELWACHNSLSRPGVRGLRAYRALLQDREGKEPTDTSFETRIQMLLVDAGLPEPVARYWVTLGGGRHRLDLAYPKQKIDIEGHSKKGHLNEVAFETDPIRNNALSVAGWMVLHVTYRRLERDPGGIVAEVRAALEQRAA